LLLQLQRIKLWIS